MKKIRLRQKFSNMSATVRSVIFSRVSGQPDTNTFFCENVGKEMVWQYKASNERKTAKEFHKYANICEGHNAVVESAYTSD